ncbi:MAG: argininosuccinate lyase [Actinomycetota bacterium]
MTEREAPLWAGRFTKAPAPEAEALSKSLGFDLRMATQDVRASVAHVRGLEDAGLLSEAEANALASALIEVGKDIEAGRMAFRPADEDVHSVVERAVTDRLGALGAKLHAGRSRNDLVVTDLRLWLLDAWARIEGGTRRLARALITHAREHAETVMPGMTHGRLAQPVTLGHHLLAHAWALSRDLDRLRGWAERTSVSPLGAGALATPTLPLDPARSAERLGFRGVFSNSLDAVSDRDFVQEFLAHAAILGTHLSRLAADLIRWSDESIGWAELDEAFSTGSSMMPQKRNPDIAELSRAKVGRLLGDFTALSTVLAGLPLGYHRDLQEDKEPLFDAADTLEATLAALAGCTETIQFRPGVMCAAARADVLYATDVAEALAANGLPFREAHRRIGDLLRRLDEEDRSLRDLSEAEWKEIGLPGGNVLLDPVRAVGARSVPGGPSPGSVRDQADALARILEGLDTLSP